MKVLITGGSGFLAGRLQQLLDAMGGNDIRLLTRSPSGSGRDERMVDWSGDSTLSDACQDMDVVIHLAGMDAQDCASDPIAALEFNGVATARLLRSAIRAGVVRFIYLSSAHVYGAALRGLVDEATCPRPRHPYATSHRAAEDVVRAAHADGAIDGVVLRLSNGFGYPANASRGCWKVIINEFCQQAVQRRIVVLRSNGMQRRDFMPASEVCRAIHHFMQAPRAELGEGLFNIGSGELRSLREVCEIVVERVEARLAFRPAVEIGTAADPVGSELLGFSIERLRRTNFAPDPKAFHREIDDLIAFCAKEGI